MLQRLASVVIVQCLLLIAFISLGNASETADTREPVQRTEAEKAFVLDQMRLFLASITEVEEALGSGDMDKVAREAAARGRKANVTLARPSTLASKESEAWKMMMGSTRTGFDRIAEEASAHASPANINKIVAETMRNCVACHQTYRISIDGR